MGTAIAEPEVLSLGPEQSRVDSRLRYFCYAALVIVVVIFAFIRIRLRTVPLERDEGENAYAGQLMLQGIPPYQLVCNMKLPGTYTAYAVMMAAFGQTIAGIRIGMLVVLLANIFLLFLLTRRLFGLLAGTVAVASYTLLANRLSTLSLDGHATHFIVLATLGGILLLFQAIEKQRGSLLFCSGLLFGLAFLMKQHGILFVMFGFLYWAWVEWRRSADQRRLISDGSILAAGIVLPYLITCLVAWRAGVFHQFWFWTVSYGAAYEKIQPLSDGWILLHTMLPWLPRPVVIWLTAGFGLTALFWDRRAREHKVFMLSFALFSILAVCPGLYFRSHYFIVMLPAVAMLAGIGISAAYGYLQQRRFSPRAAWIPIVFFILSYVSALYGQRKYLFEMSPTDLNRHMHAGHGFPEAITVADYVRNHTTDEDRIAVLGSEPEIYFYSGRHSVTGYVYMYPLLERQKYALRMQGEMIHEIEASKPKIVVYVDNQFSWGTNPSWDGAEPRMHVFNWMRDFLDEHYELLAEVPIDKAAYPEWGAQGEYYIFRRTGD
jgi:hypothetical protein